MFDFLKGGIKNKGRFFKNLNFRLLGKGGRNMKKVFAVFALSCALVLTGWGCKKAPTPADTGVEEPKVEDAGASEEGDEIPTGWKEYRNEEWGISFEYPSNWFSHAYRETVGGEETLMVAFSDEALPESLPPQPVFPISVFYRTKTVDEVTATYTETVSVNDIAIGERAVKKIVYFSDLLDQNDLVYLTSVGENTLQLFVYNKPEYISVAENIIATLEVE